MAVFPTKSFNDSSWKRVVVFLSTFLVLAVDFCSAQRNLQLAGTWQVIFEEDFEHGTDTDADIGPHFSLPGVSDDAVKHTWVDARSGTKVIKLRDDMGPESSIVSRLIDVSLYSQVDFSFYYQAEGMEDGDNFLVEFQYNDDGPWYPAADLVAGANADFENGGGWHSQCLQWNLYAGVNTEVNSIRLRIQSSGDDNSDIVYIDDVQLNGLLKLDIPTVAPTGMPTDPLTASPTIAPTTAPTNAPTPGPTTLIIGDYTCSDDSSSWPSMFTESFEYAGASNIGSIFKFGGADGDPDSVKIATGNPGVESHTGSRSVQLKGNSDASRLYSLPQDVSTATLVEFSFWFKFRVMEQYDNMFIEYLFDGTTTWTLAADIVVTPTVYDNEVWYNHCIQIDIPTGTSTISVQVRADGQSVGDNDLVFVDDLEMKYYSPASYKCSVDSSSWPSMFTESFEYAGASNIGSIFKFGGADGDPDSVKIATGNTGVESHTGSRSAQLKGNSDASRLYSLPLDVSTATHVEFSFFFRFRVLEDYDNMFVEYLFDGATTWTVTSNIVFSAPDYQNEVWYKHCIQIDIPAGTSTISVQVRSDGQSVGDNDLFFLDDLELKYYTPPNYQCSVDSTSWPSRFTESFEYAGASNIGTVFKFGGADGDPDSVKIATGNPGVESHTGSRSVQLKGNSDASRLYSLPQDVSTATLVEFSFWYKFRVLEELDDFFVEYLFDGATTWTVVSDIVFSAPDYQNEVWYKHCIQISIPAGTPTISVQVRADGSPSSSDNDLFFLDDLVLKYYSPASSYQCSVDSTRWPSMFIESFEYAGASNIGSIFKFGGVDGNTDSIKIATGNAGVESHTGSRSVQLKGNSDASRLYSLPLDVSTATHVEFSFYFRFRALETADDMFVEYLFDGATTWTVASNIVFSAPDYQNEVWYKHCIQISIPAGTSTVSVQVRANGSPSSSDNDLVFVDDLAMKYI